MLTEEQKQKIWRLRLEGRGYTSIAAELKLPLSPVKSYCRYRGLTGAGKAAAMNAALTVDKRVFCRQCGKRLRHTPGKKKKKFCSDYCRKKYWRDKNDN